MTSSGQYSVFSGQWTANSVVAIRLKGCHGEPRAKPRGRTATLCVLQAANRAGVVVWLPFPPLPSILRCAQVSGQASRSGQACSGLGMTPLQPHRQLYRSLIHRILNTGHYISAAYMQARDELAHGDTSATTPFTYLPIHLFTEYRTLNTDHRILTTAHFFVTTFR
jgi:hypothetical protein